ncbi:MAG: hypothetical protein JEZ06_12770 [Anaerolineaceae bacterium]|nr:hypothetical protein [Anaerolineaceae bacterium]
MDNKSPRTVGKKEGIGFGIIAIGIIMFMMPGISQQIADFGFGSSAYAIITGATFVFAFFTLLAGAVVAFSNLEDEELDEE